jgi:hypothetical protein
VQLALNLARATPETAWGDSGTSASASAPDLFTAFQQQLGLKLEPARAPVDVMVIDKVDNRGTNRFKKRGQADIIPTRSVARVIACFPAGCDRSKGPMTVSLSGRLLEIASGRCA